MSRIGLKPIALPDGVDVRVEGAQVTVQGPNGTLTQEIPDGISVEREEGCVRVRRKGDDKRSRSLHGLIRALLANHVQGVKEGYKKELEIHGVSYQANLAPGQLTLKVGYANEIVLPIPEGVEVEVPNPTFITVSGADKQKVGQFAAEIRAARPPEPYKGKGIRYRGEHISRKQGKSFVGSE